MNLRIGALLLVIFSLSGSLMISQSYAGITPSIGASDCESPSIETDVEAIMPSSEIFWNVMSHEITYDQNFGAWQKNLLPVSESGSFDVDDDTSGESQTFFLIIEEVTVGQGAAFTDWHEEIVNSGWAWQSGEISIIDSETVEGIVDGNKIWFFFDEPLQPGTIIEIEKEFAYVGLDGKFDTIPTESATITDDEPLVILQFPTIENGCSNTGPTLTIQDLIDTVISMNLADGTEKSLLSNLNSAIEKLSDENPDNNSAACGKLVSFIHKVDAQTGKKLSEYQAVLLTGMAKDILASIGC